MSRHSLNSQSLGAVATSWGSMVQGPTTLSVRNLFLKSNLNFLWHGFIPFPRVIEKNVQFHSSSSMKIKIYSDYIQENWSSCRITKESMLPSSCICLGGFLKSKLKTTYSDFAKVSFPPCFCPFQTSSGLRNDKHIENQVLDLKLPSKHRWWIVIEKITCMYFVYGENIIEMYQTTYKSTKYVFLFVCQLKTAKGALHVRSVQLQIWTNMSYTLYPR